MALAISNPVCEETLILLLTPNLDVIVPETGLINDIPKFTFPPEVVSAVLTLPEALYLYDFRVPEALRMARIPRQHCSQTFPFSRDGKGQRSFPFYPYQSSGTYPHYTAIGIQNRILEATAHPRRYHHQSLPR